MTMRPLMSVRGRIGAVLIIAGAAVAGSPARAHHSVPGSFNIDKTTVIKGAVSKIDWIPLWP